MPRFPRRPVLAAAVAAPVNLALASRPATPGSASSSSPSSPIRLWRVVDDTGDTRDRVVGHFPSCDHAAIHGADEPAQKIEPIDCPSCWFVVVEVGEELPEVASASLQFSGEIGTEARWAVRPLRLVRPTADEVARFAV